MQNTPIEWTDCTWNCVRGCSRVSQGCTNCYAEKVAGRFSGPGLAYEGLARMKAVSHHEAGAERRVRLEGRWTGEVRMVPEHLADPLRWKRPRRIFVNSMSDLFHEKLSNEDIAAVFGVMAAAPQHTFQVLTKRAERMREWFDWAQYAGGEARNTAAEMCRSAAMDRIEHRDAEGRALPGPTRALFGYDDRWPLPNVHLGVSVEDEPNARRIHDLLRTPAAVRFVSYEPALGEVDWPKYIRPKAIVDGYRKVQAGMDYYSRCGPTPAHLAAPGVDWVIVGGESGPGARPFDVAWARSVVQQCKAAGVPAFCKQMGSRPYDGEAAEPTGNFRTHEGRRQFEMKASFLELRSKKGGDPSEWPPGDWPREFPRSGT